MVKFFFWDHELEAEPGFFFKSVALISESFDDFLSRLCQWKNPDENEIENAIKEDVMLFDFLLTEDFDLEKKDEYGRTMLENAAIHNSIKIIRYLYLKGAELRDSLKYAEQNAEFFEEHKKSVDFIKSLELNETKGG